MRSYATISPMFWVRGSGKRLRGDANAQIVALYLMTCPAATMVGIFPLSLTTLAHETGLTLEGASKGLARCSEEGLAFYDAEDEMFWVPALARHQIGERLGLGKTGKPDKRIAGVARALRPFKGHRFYDEFLDRYAGAYMLDLEKEGAPSKPLPRGYDLDLDLVPAPDLVPVQGVQGETRPSIGDLAAMFAKDPMMTTMRHGNPDKWPELVALWDAFKDTWGREDRPVGSRDPRVTLALERFAEGRSVGDLVRAIANSKNYQPIAGNRAHQRLKTILRDAEQIDMLLTMDQPGEPSRPIPPPRQPNSGFDFDEDVPWSGKPPKSAGAGT